MLTPNCGCVGAIINSLVATLYLFHFVMFFLIIFYVEGRLGGDLILIDECVLITFADDLEHCHHSEVTWSLPHGCVLSQILAAQMLCDLDIESLYPHYERISSYLSQHPDER